MAGTRVGLRDVYFAKLIKDDETGVSYDVPVKVGKAIEASVSPNTNSETLNADDGPSEIETAFGGTEIEIGVDQLSHDVQALLLGHTINADGVLEKKATDLAPYGALLFRAQVSGGGYKLYAFYKGKFQLQEESFATKTDSPEFQTDSITGTFMRRAYDEVWSRSVFTEGEGVNKPVVNDWFTKVYEPTTSAPAPAPEENTGA
ncbi:major tail protein [Bacillus halotolerans]|uniref:major tail protein n=1 Tax=Bacillus halotolerans TaxID=260554 RepID=UPI002DBF703F|nr:major tail protein [Bacillus halotolerans]MEC1648160.1 phage tail protein [Bacillus halotolerans]